MSSPKDRKSKASKAKVGRRDLPPGSRASTSKARAGQKPASAVRPKPAALPPGTAKRSGSGAPRLSAKANGAKVLLSAGIKLPKSSGKAAGKPRTADPVKEQVQARSTGRAGGGMTNKITRDSSGTRAPARSKARGEVTLPPGYRPSETEPFMNERQRLYFRTKLIAWKDDIIRQNIETLQGLHEDSSQHADLADRATSETDRALELRARDRQRKLIAKIEAALARIEEGTYGYCEDTGEPIGLKRLDARPIATLSIEAQERHERRERVFRED